MLMSYRTHNEEVDYQDYHTIPEHDNSDANNSVRMRYTCLSTTSVLSENCDSGGRWDETGIVDRRCLHRGITCRNLSWRDIAPEFEWIYCLCFFSEFAQTASSRIF